MGIAAAARQRLCLRLTDFFHFWGAQEGVEK
jgi:hypothetical protein